MVNVKCYINVKEVEGQKQFATRILSVPLAGAASTMLNGENGDGTLGSISRNLAERKREKGRRSR